MNAECELAERRCKPCEGGVSPLTREQAQASLEQVPGWELSEDGSTISHRIKLKNFHEIMDFINSMAGIANAEDHHPDFSAGYNYCLVNYTTHAIGGLSENDFICAAKLNKLL